MNPWILASVVVACLAAVTAYPYPQAVDFADVDFPSYDAAEVKAMDSVKADHGHKGGGGGHGHGKATSYQVSNNWAYHPVKVYVKHHGKH